MGNRAHTTWFSVCEVNLPRAFCFDHLDPMFVADFSVDEVFRCSCINHGIERE